MFYINVFWFVKFGVPRKWLHTYLKGEAYPAPPLLEMQLRSNWATREQFDLWPSARIEYSTLATRPKRHSMPLMRAPLTGCPTFLTRRSLCKCCLARQVPSPRGTDLYGELATKASPSEQVFDTITFSKATGISAGVALK